MPGNLPGRDGRGKIFDASGSGDDIVLASVEALVNAINLTSRARNRIPFVRVVSAITKPGHVWQGAGAAPDRGVTPRMPVISRQREFSSADPDNLPEILAGHAGGRTMVRCWGEGVIPFFPVAGPIMAGYGFMTVIRGKPGRGVIAQDIRDGPLCTCPTPRNPVLPVGYAGLFARDRAVPGSDGTGLPCPGTTVCPGPGLFP